MEVLDLDGKAFFPIIAKEFSPFTIDSERDPKILKSLHTLCIQHPYIARILVPHRPITTLWVPMEPTDWSDRRKITIADALPDYALSSAKEGIESFTIMDGIAPSETLPILEKLLVYMPNLRRLGDLEPFEDEVGFRLILSVNSPMHLHIRTQKSSVCYRASSICIPSVS